ncbi:hypothetical protein [Nocardiopsis sp. NPDC006938]|uniref:hypothetical protein n=1 Tax=Nocardiopsis sp. NPDC006938 TaxID=3364337 RepID=UPI00367E84DF
MDTATALRLARAAWSSLPEAAQGTIAVILTLVLVAGGAWLGYVGVRALWRHATALLARARRVRVSAETLYETAAPIGLGVVILLLVFPGLVHFAQDIAGIRPPLSWLVIVVVEFLALWFAIVRFREAQRGYPAPVATVMTWVVICAASYLQRTKAEADPTVEPAGVLFLGALPFALGAVVEFALHMRRKRVADEKTHKRNRNVDAILKAHPVEYAQLRIKLAAHPEWTTPQALHAVRVDRASAVLMELREARNSPMTTVPQRLEEGTRRELRRNRKEVAVAQRLNEKRDALIHRLEKRAIRHMTRLGFAGEPTESRAVDLLRAMQVRTRVGEVAGLDYSQRETTLSILGTMVTTEEGTPGTSQGAGGTPGTRRVGAGVPDAETGGTSGTSQAGTVPGARVPGTPDQAGTTPGAGTQAGTAPAVHPARYLWQEGPSNPPDEGWVPTTQDAPQGAGTVPGDAPTQEVPAQVSAQVPRGTSGGDRTPPTPGVVPAQTLGAPGAEADAVPAPQAGTPATEAGYPTAHTTPDAPGTSQARGTRAGVFGTSPEVPAQPQTPQAGTPAPGAQDAGTPEVPDAGTSGTSVGTSGGTSGTSHPEEGDDDPEDDGPQGGGTPTPEPNSTKKATIMTLLDRHHGDTSKVRAVMDSDTYQNVFGETAKSVVYRVRNEHWLPEVLHALYMEKGNRVHVIAELEKRMISYNPDKVNPILDELVSENKNVRPIRPLAAAQEG